MRIRVRPTVRIYGFDPGVEVEVDLDDKIRDLIQAGYLLLLRPRRGQNLPE